jgi:hypothetical protein
MPHTHDLHCVDGCGRVLGRVTLPDGIQFKGDAHYGLVCEEEHAPLRRQLLQQLLDNEAAQEVIARRVRLRADIEAIKNQDGFTDAYVDDDNNPATPGVLKRIWNRIFG